MASVLTKYRSVGQPNQSGQNACGPGGSGCPTPPPAAPGPSTPGGPTNAGNSAGGGSGGGGGHGQSGLAASGSAGGDMAEAPVTGPQLANGLKPKQAPHSGLDPPTAVTYPFNGKSEDQVRAEGLARAEANAAAVGGNPQTLTEDQQAAADIRRNGDFRAGLQARSDAEFLYAENEGNIDPGVPHTPSGVTHAALGTASFVPGIGTPAALLDAGVYAAEGDNKSAGIAALSAIPLVKGVKVAVEGSVEAAKVIKATRAAEEAADTAAGAVASKTTKNISAGEPGQAAPPGAVTTKPTPASESAGNPAQNAGTSPPQITAPAREPGATLEGGNANVRALTRADLSPSQVSNLNRYVKKLPAAAEDTAIRGLPDGSTQFETRVPGRVPDSYALYTKTISKDGITVGYTKTTVLPDGSVAHVKDKLSK